MATQQKIGGTPTEDDVLQTKRLWRIRKTIFQMLRDRDYVVTPAELNETLDEFKAKFGNMPTKRFPERSALDHLATHIKRSHEMLQVVFHDGKMGVRDSRFLEEKYKDTAVQRIVIVVKEALTGPAQAHLDGVPNIRFETFLDEDLMFNVTEHELVPKHIVMTPEQKKQLMEVFGLEESQMTILPRTDPVARYFGMEVGQVVRILRVSLLSGPSTCYRIVK